MAESACRYEWTIRSHRRTSLSHTRVSSTRCSEREWQLLQCSTRSARLRNSLCDAKARSSVGRAGVSSSSSSSTNVARQPHAGLLITVDGSNPGASISGPEGGPHASLSAVGLASSRSGKKSLPKSKSRLSESGAVDGNRNSGEV